MGIKFLWSFSLYDFELAIERTGKLAVAQMRMIGLLLHINQL